MRDPLVWVTFSQDFEWHVGLEQRTFTAGKTCQVPANVARVAIARQAAVAVAVEAVAAAPKSPGKAKAKTAPATSSAKPAAKAGAKAAAKSAPKA